MCQTEEVGYIDVAVIDNNVILFIIHAQCNTSVTDGKGYLRMLGFVMKCGSSKKEYM